MTSVSSSRSLNGAIPISLKERLTIAVGVTAVYSLYHPLAIFTQDLPYWAPITFVDTAVPLSPAWMYPYAFVFFVAFVPAAIINERELFIRMALSYLCVQLTAFTLFILMPVRMTLRPEWVQVNSFETWALQLCYLADKPVNCCPSLHVALAFLGALATRTVDRLVGNIGLIIALIISLSTMFVKQHLLFDVLLGLLISGLSFKLIVVPFKPEITVGIERKNGRKRGLIMLAVYTLILVGLYFSYLGGWTPWA